jgi:hypothetical protein
MAAEHVGRLGAGARPEGPARPERAIVRPGAGSPAPPRERTDPPSRRRRGFRAAAGDAIQATFGDPPGLHVHIGNALIPHMTLEGTHMGRSKKEIPIYERLAEGECLVILRDEDGVLVACNKKGDVALKRVPYPKRKGTGA